MGKRYCSETNVVINQGCGHTHRRTGRGAGGGQLPPPIRAVCRHEFGQRVDIIRAKHNNMFE